MKMSKSQMGRRLLGFAVAGVALAAGGAAFAELGQPAPWEHTLQESASPVMDNIIWFHNFLFWLITIIALFVLGLLIAVVVKFNARSNPVPSRTTHNTLIEVAWTLIPVLILVGIAVPSFRLLFQELDIPKADLTIKATGKQWYWSYAYPDNGKFEFDSLLAQDKKPRLLGVDNEMVVPVNKVVRIQTTGADVIHSFAVPAFGIKIDSIPGRLLSVVDHNAIELSPRISEADVADYIALLEPRVMSLVIFTALVGLMMAPGHFHPVLAFTSLLCIAVGAGASGALNMAYEGDIDAKMSRTANRPIPRGRITKAEALTFGMTLAFFSVMTLGILVNWFAGALLAFTIFFYVVIYTIALKRRTAQNIVIGGAAGALPPVVAWAAATGSLSVEPLLLFLIIFFWTPPHFWALALFRSDDYARAGVPMLPVVAGPDATRLQILLYTIVLVAVAFAPWPLGYFDAVYGVTSLLLGAGMLVLAVNVYRRREGIEALRATRKLFAFSILYLFALFATLLLEVVARALAPSIW